MKSKTINTIEINGKAIDLSKKMVEVPRRKKFFETSKAYSKYLESILKEAFPYDENVHSIEDYDYFIDYNVLKLWEAADETKETLGKKVSRKITETKEKFSKNKEEEEVVEEEEKKETLLTKLLKPIKFVGKVIVLPFTLAWTFGKTIDKGIRKGFKWINSKMTWSKNKDIELEEPEENYEEFDIDLEEPVESYIPITETNDKEKEAQEELSKGVKDELAKANEEETKKLIESLNARVEELNKENQTLKNRVEIYKKQPERDKVWEKYFAEQKEKEETKEMIRNTEKEMIDNRFGVKKPSVILTELNKENIKNKCMQPYTITKEKNSVRVYKDGIKEYQESQKLSETNDTITITGTLYENLLYSEYELNVHMRDMALKAYKVPFYQVDYNYNGLIKKNKEKIGGKVVNASVVLTKERYEQLTENAAKYFSFMAEVSNYLPVELEKDNQKKLVK